VLREFAIQYPTARVARTNLSGVRREAKRHAALAAKASLPKAVSLPRPATAPLFFPLLLIDCFLQKRTRMSALQ
jgi:hypothetical protein